MMSEARLAAGMGGAVVVLAAAGWLLGRAATPDVPPAPLPMEIVMDEGTADRAVAPVVQGRALAPTPSENRAPEPTAWAGGDGGVPTATWWSALAAPTDDATTVWAQPLALRWEDETLAVSLRGPEASGEFEGVTFTPFVPTLRLTGTLAERPDVVDAGPLHVRLATDAATLTLAQGMPVIEIDLVDGAEPAVIEIPGISPDTTAFAGGVHIRGAEGTWTIAGADVASIDGVRVELRPEGDRIVLAPMPGDADLTAWEASLASAVAAPLMGSDEALSLDPDGAARQVLTWDRGAGVGPIAWPDDRLDELVDAPEPIGHLDSALGRMTVFAAGRLTVRAAAVDTSFTPDGITDPGALVAAIETDLENAPAPTAGSYFGGKRLWYHARLADLATAAGAPELADRALEVVRDGLADLADPTAEPRLTWNDEWGAVVMVPAEFGSDVELNDHQLQYGYWVAAAAVLAEHDPVGTDAFRELVDVLAADLGGADAAPPDTSARADGLADHRIWSAYHGHGWASGLARFADGNNLESISESSFAWWAVARWRLATDRDDAAVETQLARFTIETHRGADRWLPTGPVAGRPWSGVVWAAKSDPSTWFHASPEAALGIRLLPLGPNSLARYSTDGAVEAAERRWAWCAGHGGCADLWPGLLGSDAVVAGAPEPVLGAEPETGTGTAVLEWWRQRWG